MQFKHPELLYALLLLLIPILIHLFQLRRFKKVAFTNVKFLKDIEVQTRKSSQLKKWLILLTRMLILTCIVLAFAQPFTTNSDNFKATQETVIYLDNSFSMQAKGSNGSLLNTAVTSLLETMPETDKISLFTNNNTFLNTTLKAIKNDLIQLEYSSSQLPYNAVLLNGERLFSKDAESQKNLLLISDFQQLDEDFSNSLKSYIKLTAIQLQPKIVANVSIDSVAVQINGSDTMNLEVFLKQHGNPYQEMAVSLFNDEVLVAKTAVDFELGNSVVFSIPANEIFKGKLVIEDDYLVFDNDFYFNLNTNNLAKVLEISEVDDRFLHKIYNEERFDFTSTSLQNLNYSLIANQNLIVLNELESIPENLITVLGTFVNNNGHLVVIPSANANLDTYNKLLSLINARSYGRLITNEKRITNINFSHPLLNNVFDKTVDNFQYPKVDRFFSQGMGSSAVLSFEDGNSFLQQYNTTYVFTAPISADYSNFKQSPLIVPVFYNIGERSLKLPRLYYTIGNTNTIDIAASVGTDEILTLNNEETAVIPMQQAFNQKVSITTDEFPASSGIVDIKQKDQVLGQLSYNYSRKESDLRYLNMKDYKDLNYYQTVTAAIDSIKSASNINALWKWFVIFALCFLALELLILKYFK